MFVLLLLVLVLVFLPHILQTLPDLLNDQTCFVFVYQFRGVDFVELCDFHFFAWTASAHALLIGIPLYYKFTIADGARKFIRNCFTLHVWTSTSYRAATIGGGILEAFLCGFVFCCPEASNLKDSLELGGCCKISGTAPVYWTYPFPNWTNHFYGK